MSYEHLLTKEQNYIVEKLVKGFGFEHLGEASKFLWCQEPKLEVHGYQLYETMDNIAVVVSGEFFCIDVENVDYPVCRDILDGIHRCILANKAKWDIQNPSNITQATLFN